MTTEITAARSTRATGLTTLRSTHRQVRYGPNQVIEILRATLRCGFTLPEPQAPGRATASSSLNLKP